MELPFHWKKLNKKPFVSNGQVENNVYMILFFDLKRAVLLRKDYTVICTIETRKARLLLEEAQIKKWVNVIIKDCELGDRPPNYPKKSDITYWIEVKNEG